MSSNAYIQSLPYRQVLPKKIWLKLTVLSLLFLYSISGAIMLLIDTWTSRDDYSHGFLVPFISLYFIWAEKEKLKHIPVFPNMAGGLSVLLVGIMMLLTGNVGGIVVAQQLSIIVIIPGLALMLLGTRMLKAMLLPLTYLILMVPILDVLFDNIHWPFQLFTATMSGKILSLLGISVFQNANFLEFPNITFEVAEECSGLNYLVSIIAIAIPLAYFSQKKLSRRIILVCISFVIAVVVNTIRVVLIGIWSYMGGEVVHGPLHIFQGLFVSVIGFVILFIVAFIFSKYSYGEETFNEEKSISSKHDVAFDSKRFNRAWFTAVIVFISLAGYLYAYSPVKVPLKANFNKLPLSSGQWESMENYHTTPIFAAPGADVVLSRTYRNASGREIVFYAGYFETQTQGKEIVHNQLWQLYKNAEKMEIDSGNKTNFRVNKTVIEQGRKKYLATYWYSLDGEMFASNLKAKLVTAIDGITHMRTNGAIFIIYSPLKSGDSESMLLEDEKDFIRQVAPLLNDFLPGPV